MKYRAVTFTEVLLLIAKISDYLVDMTRNGDFAADTILGVLYGGGVPAALLAKNLGIVDVHFHRIQRFKEVGVLPHVEGSTLVVDDIVDTGWTLTEIQKQLGPVTAVSLFQKRGADPPPTFAPEIVDADVWIIFPWETSRRRQIILDGKIMEEVE